MDILSNIKVHKTKVRRHASRMSESQSLSLDSYIMLLWDGYNGLLEDCASWDEFHNHYFPLGQNFIHICKMH